MADETPPGEDPTDDRTVTVGSDGYRDDGSVTVGSDGYRPDDERAGTTAGVEDAVPAPSGAFDWRGWLLVAVVVVSFLVVPVVVALRPVRVGGFTTTYLLLPLVPAVLLGATAVWVAVRSRQGGP